MLEKEISENLIAHDQVCLAKFKLAGICKNLTLDIANIFSTVYETLLTLEAKSIAYHFNLSIWIVFTAGLRIPRYESNNIMKIKFFKYGNQCYQSIWHQMGIKKYKNTFRKTPPPVWRLQVLKRAIAGNMN